MSAYTVEMLANIKYGRDKYIMTGDVFDLNDEKVNVEIRTLLRELLKHHSRLVRDVVVPTPVEVPDKGVPDDVLNSEPNDDDNMDDGTAMDDGTITDDHSVSQKKGKLKT